MARAHVGGSDLVAQQAWSSAGTPALQVPAVGDCFSAPRGSCEISRFATGEWRLQVPGTTAKAVTVLDAVAAGETPSAAVMSSGSGWRATELDRGGAHLAVVSIDAGASSVTYTAKAGTHVVVGAPAGADGRADVIASGSGGACTVTVSAHSGATGGFDARPVVVSVDSNCVVSEDVSRATTDPTNGNPTGGGTGGGTGSGSGSDGGSGADGGGTVTAGCSSTAPGSGSLPLPLAMFGLALRRRRRQTPR
jgi:MYXO-CTERM domain-containing protein